MDYLKRSWGALSRADRAVLAVALVALVALTIAGIATRLDRPGDIRNRDVEFVVKPDQGGTGRGIQGAISWRFYGLDRARTKFLDTPRLRPPFRQLWKYRRGELLEFAPIATKGRIYGIDNDAVFFALRSRRGTEVWRHKYGQLSASSPAYQQGHLYAVTLDPAQALAVKSKTGKLAWRRPLPSRAESSPVTVGRRMYFGTENGEFYALRLGDGKVVWTTRLDGEVKAAPAYDDGNLYVGDYAGKMYSIDASDGSINWKSSDLGTGLGRSGRFYSTPAVAFGRVYAGNVDGRVYSFSKSSGEIAWTYSAGNYVYSGVAVADTGRTRPAVYFGSHDSNLYAVDAETGELIWKRSAGGQVSGPAVVIGPVVYISSFTGNSTFGYDLKSARKVFKIEEGEYGPVFSNGRLVYVVGDDTITALEPIKQARRAAASKNAGKGKRPGKGRKDSHPKLGQGTKLKERRGTIGIIGAVPRPTGRRDR